MADMEEDFSNPLAGRPVRWSVLCSAGCADALMRCRLSRRTREWVTDSFVAVGAVLCVGPAAGQREL